MQVGTEQRNNAAHDPLAVAHASAAAHDLQLAGQELVALVHVHGLGPGLGTDAPHPGLGTEQPQAVCVSEAEQTAE